MMATYLDQIGQKGNQCELLVVEEEPEFLGQQAWTLPLGKLFGPLN